MAGTLKWNELVVGARTIKLKQGLNFKRRGDLYQADYEVTTKTFTRQRSD